MSLSPESCVFFDVGTVSFQILPGVKVIIAHTETKGPLGDSHLGEVRLALASGASGISGTAPPVFPSVKLFGPFPAPGHICAPVPSTWVGFCGLLR